MRTLGLILIAASISLSAGGVSYRPQDPGQQTRAQPDPADDPQAMCVSPGPEPSVRRTRIRAPQVTRPVRSLGTRGFNYSRPGDPMPTEVRPASGAPASPAR